MPSTDYEIVDADALEAKEVERQQRFPLMKCDSPSCPEPPYEVFGMAGADHAAEPCSFCADLPGHGTRQHVYYRPV